jgi:hypothetical protein
MRIKSRSGLALLALVLLLQGLACACPRPLAPYYPFANPICLEAPYSLPPSCLVESDLEGTWEADYHQGIDTLTIKSDGTFRQVYKDAYQEGYTYETAWQEWWLERFGDGRIRIHFKGARYYMRGIRVAELDGLGSPSCPTTEPGCSGEPFPLPRCFVDPFSGEDVQMPGELVLNVRADSSGSLLLHQMFYHADEGFPLSGCGTYHFRRVETSLQR